MVTRNSRSSSELLSSSIPLISFSRSPSPYTRKAPSSALSEDDDDDDESDQVAVDRPLFGVEPSSSRRRWTRWLKDRTLGGWLLGTCAGWQVYVGLLVVLMTGFGFGLLAGNRLILWSECRLVWMACRRLTLGDCSWCIQVGSPALRLL
jgi:hypothetical protein